MPLTWYLGAAGRYVRAPLQAVWLARPEADELAVGTCVGGSQRTIRRRRPPRPKGRSRRAKTMATKWKPPVSRALRYRAAGRPRLTAKIAGDLRKDWPSRAPHVGRDLQRPSGNNVPGSGSFQAAGPRRATGKSFVSLPTAAPLWPRWCWR